MGFWQLMVSCLGRLVSKQSQLGLVSDSENFQNLGLGCFRGGRCSHE